MTIQYQTETMEASERLIDETNDKTNTGGEEDPTFQTLLDFVKTGQLTAIQNIVVNQGTGVLSHKDEKGHSLVHWAALGGHASLIRYFLEMGIPFNESSTTSDLGQTPIHWACIKGHIAVVDILAQAGVPLDIADNKGVTPLIVACQYGHPSLAAYLMGKGVKLKITDRDGDNALHWAAFKGHAELMRLLIYSGFEPQQKDNYGQTPLHLSCLNGNLLAVRQLCEEDEVKIDMVDKNGKTPLMLALARGHTDIVNYLKREAKNRNSLLAKFDIRTIIFGPTGNTKIPFLFYIINLVFWGYPMYFFKGLPETWEEFPELNVLFIIFNILMWIALYHANTSDPGYLPRNIPEYDHAIKQAAFYDEWKQGKNPLTRLCHTCRTIKPIRSKHCKVCNRCVVCFDHHCPYIYNCVGYNNRGWFLAFVTCVFSCGIITLYLAGQVLTKEFWQPLVLFGGVETIMFTFLTGGLTFCAVASAAINLTTNERINYARYDYLKDSKGEYRNPFNRGVIKNFMEYFHLTPTRIEEQFEPRVCYVV